MALEISDYLQDINDRTYLPGLQREFVWDSGQIENLFDSLIRDYPVGLITRWDAARSAENYHAYKFITNYIMDSGRAPGSLEEKGYTRYNEELEGEDPSFLVIDGQQRLTSLNIGLFGRLTEYTAGMGGRRSNLGDWSSYELCVNLFGHPDFDTEKLSGDYEFEFRKTGEFDDKDIDDFGFEETEKEDGGVVQRYWYPLPQLMDEDRTLISESKFHEETDEYIENLDLSVTSRDNLKNAKRTVFSNFSSRVLDSEIPTKDVKKQSNDIKEIFQRINIEGEKPKPYQILLSKMMSIWPFTGTEEERFNPREEIEDWIGIFQNKFDGYETSIERDLFLRYSCYLMNAQLKTKDVKALNESKMIEMRNKWFWEPEEVTTYDDFEWFIESLEAAFDSLGNIGFTDDTMDTMSMVGSLGKFYYRNPDADSNDPENLNAIYRFLAQMLLYARSKGSVSRVEARRISEFLHEQEQGKYEVFPAEEAFNHLDTGIAEETVEKVVAEAHYSAGTVESNVFSSWDTAAILGLSNGIYTSNDISEYQVDHIFPASESDRIQEAAGIDDGDFSIHRIGNLQLLPEDENQRKSDKMPEVWLSDLTDREADRYRRINHYNGLSLDASNYQKFVEKREERLIDAVTNEISD